jgi:hypothetical protein
MFLLHETYTASISLESTSTADRTNMKHNRIGLLIQRKVAKPSSSDILPRMHSNICSYTEQDRKQTIDVGRVNL